MSCIGVYYRVGSLWRWQLWGAETRVNNELAELGRFSEGNRGEFGKEILGRWIGGEDMETFPEDTFDTMKTRIVDGGDHGIAVFG